MSPSKLGLCTGSWKHSNVRTGQRVVRFRSDQLIQYALPAWYQNHFFYSLSHLSPRSVTFLKSLTCIKRLGLRAVGALSIHIPQTTPCINLPMNLGVRVPGPTYELHSKPSSIGMVEPDTGYRCKDYPECPNFVRSAGTPCIECVVNIPLSCSIFD